MEEKPLGKALILLMPSGEQIPFRELDGHITQFPEFEPGGYVNDKPSKQFSGESVLLATRRAPLIKPSPEMQRRIVDLNEEIVKNAHTNLAHYEAIKPVAFKIVPTRSYVKYIIKKQGKLKLPRKLKKAFKHIYLPSVSPNETVIVKCARFFRIKTFIEGYGIKPGYPHTKWTRKAMSFLKFKFEAI